MSADVKPPAESSRPVASAAESSGPLDAPDGVPVVKRHKAKRVYRCCLCSKVLQNGSNLNRHIRSHGTPHVWFKSVGRLFPSRHQVIQMQLNLHFSFCSSCNVCCPSWQAVQM